MEIFARTALNSWSPVLEQNEAGCFVLKQDLGFEEVWAGRVHQLEPEAADLSVFYSWSELLCPLPHVDVPCWAYAMSYAEHRRETKISKTFRFPKNGPARVMGDEIPYRPYLDYEAEIGLLMGRETPDRFGFVMLNDLTDRGIQVLGDSKDQTIRADCYTRAKSFPGALLVGPLLAVGDTDDWLQLELTLSVNGTERQRVRAVDCLLAPSLIHNELFSTIEDHAWLLAATGTAGGIMLTIPSLYRRLLLLAQSRLSVAAARQRHLSRQIFLGPGDVLVMSSPQLGFNRATVIAPGAEHSPTVQL